MTNPFKLAAVVGRITVWYASLPNHKPESFTCSELTRLLGLTMRQLHVPLIILGWHRAEIWTRSNNKRVRRVLYAPPGMTVPRPQRGRPRFNLNDHLDIIFL